MAPNSNTTPETPDLNPWKCATTRGLGCGLYDMQVSQLSPVPNGTLMAFRTEGNSVMVEPKGILCLHVNLETGSSAPSVYRASHAALELLWHASGCTS